MRADDIRLLLDYDAWASDRIFDLAATLTPQQLRAPISAGWTSLLGTLFHLAEAHYAWRHMLTDGAFSDYLAEADYPDVASIRALMLAERELLSEVLRGWGDAELAAPFSYDTEYGPRRRLRWQCLWHLVNHGTQHRAECAAILTKLGHSPGDLDLSVYLRAR